MIRMSENLREEAIIHDSDTSESEEPIESLDLTNMKLSCGGRKKNTPSQNKGDRLKIND